VQPASDGIDLTLENDVLRRALAQVVVAASRDETRPVLTGVLFEGDASELRLVATDSYRLALRTLPITGADGLKMLVPARAVQEAARLSGAEQIRLSTGGSQVTFEAGNTVVRSRLIEGEFPAYRQLLPDTLPNHLEADRASFIESLRRVAIVAQDGAHFFLELDEAEVRFTCQSQGLGDANEVVDADYKGDPMRVAFNPAYLQGGVEAVEDERVRIELADAQRPCLVRGAAADRFVYLLMPVRIG
jgi:DNA polymerase-3 subunit beta